jgi:hypothetical protein
MSGSWEWVVDDRGAAVAAGAGTFAGDPAADEDDDGAMNGAALENLRS